MKPKLARVFPFLPGRDHRYDAEFVTLGYEDRALATAEKLPVDAKFRFAFGFQQDRLFSYYHNKKWFTEHGYTVQEPSEEQFGDQFKQALQTVLAESGSDGQITIRIDISSLTRFRMACIVSSLCSLEQRNVEVHFVYTLAEFVSPPEELTPNTHVGPVIPEFAGWWIEPDRPIIAIVGLGYEQNKALGAVEHVQASEIWVFTPLSPIAEYSPELEKANAALLNDIDQRHRLGYRVSQPFDCFAQIESLTAGALRIGNPMLFPFGPKIFALASMLVAVIHPEVAVWRVSGAEKPINRSSSGYFYGLGAVFGIPTDRINLVENSIPELIGSE